jgi:hypothetical protein
VDGRTLTVCVHWASSASDTAPASAYDPECTGLVITLSSGEHDQPDRLPVSNPGLASRLACAAALTVASPLAATASTTTVTTAASLERRARMRPP